MIWQLDIILLVLVFVSAVGAIVVKDLLASVILLGAYSLFMCLLWVEMGAVDVAFTEAAVGAAITAVLFVILGIEFDLRDRFHTFKAGHRTMVQVQSSWFPVIDRNPQTFVDIYSATEDDFQAATQRIYRTAERIALALLASGEFGASLNEFLGQLRQHPGELNDARLLCLKLASSIAPQLAVLDRESLDGAS